MQQKIITYIKEEISIELVDDIDVQEDLLGTGIIDSMGIMKLIDFIEKEMEISIPQEDMVIENFMNIERIVAYLNDKKTLQ